MTRASGFKAVFIHRDPVDMRKATNGLSIIVEEAKMGELMGVPRANTIEDFERLADLILARPTTH